MKGSELYSTNKLVEYKTIMTKPEFVKLVAKDADITIRDANVAVAAVFDNLRKLLIAGDTFTVNRFCTFKTVERAGRNGRSPATGEQIWIEPSKSAKIALSSVFKAELNGKTVSE